jgi:hypothetical protein
MFDVSPGPAASGFCGPQASKQVTCCAITSPLLSSHLPLTSDGQTTQQATHVQNLVCRAANTWTCKHIKGIRDFKGCTCNIAACTSTHALTEGILCRIMLSLSPLC